MRRWMLGLLVTALLLAGLVQATGRSSSGRRSPANPEDLEINRAWEERVAAEGGSPENTPGLVEPVLSRVLGREVRIPHTDQAEGGVLKNLLSHDPEEAVGALSSTGRVIETVSDPHQDLFFAVLRMSNSAFLGIVDTDAAEDALDVLLGRTEGRIYDGFPLLNFNRWNSLDVPVTAYAPGTVTGEYKMKQIRWTGETQPHWFSPDRSVNVWEIDVNFFWYDQQFDSDTFLIKVPQIDADSGLEPQPDDVLRVNYTIYSLVEEDFAPTQVLLDAQTFDDFQARGTAAFPYKGQDTVWVRIHPETVTHLTVQHTALRFFRGIYNWGWNVHPPRIQFLQLVYETQNYHTGAIEWDPEALSYATRNRELDIDGIGLAAPERKVYDVARAAIDGTASAAEIWDMLNDPDITPSGVWGDWIGLMSDQRQLPPEARAILDAEGLTVDDFDFLSVFLNNEMYGTGPLGHTIRPWSQGETMRIKLFNLDNHTHYYRNVGFGPQLHNDLAQSVDDGLFSFEIMNFKPLYGAPKVAEMQWRAGWGFRPHYGVIQQADVFPRESDQAMLLPFVGPDLTTQEMDVHLGYRYSEAHRGGDFHFDPPDYVIKTGQDHAFETLHGLPDLTPDQYDLLPTIAVNWQQFIETFPERVQAGIIIGQHTEGFGVAKMCPDDPLGDFCTEDIGAFHPRGARNYPDPWDISVFPKTELRFPKFLRNSDPEAGGDIIPPTPLWKPFLYINPEDGTLAHPRKEGYWADDTYAHGRTVLAGEVLELNIEMPRASGQLFYQFDDLFHDNSIFSPHPIND